MKRQRPDDDDDEVEPPRGCERWQTAPPRSLSVEDATAGCDGDFWLSCVHDTRCDRRKSGCDLMTFATMTHDVLRMRSYERDIHASVKGKRVLEVGTGALAPLTQMCIAGGAREVLTVERSPWAADAASELLAPHRHCRVVTGDATTLTVADAGGDGAFDVLVHEVYGCVAGAEGVIETCEALRRAGFSWDRVVSRGYDVLVAPCVLPPLDLLPPPLLSLCANPGGEDGLEIDLRAHNWSVHCSPAQMLLAQPQVWQAADLEKGTHSTAATLTFSLPSATAASSGPSADSDADPTAELAVKYAAGRFAGFLFFSRFFFHCDEDTLDTLTQPTHWGSFFVRSPVNTCTGVGTR